MYTVTKSISLESKLNWTHNQPLLVSTCYTIALYFTPLCPPQKCILCIFQEKEVWKLSNHHIHPHQRIAWQQICEMFNAFFMRGNYSLRVRYKLEMSYVCIWFQSFLLLPWRWFHSLHLMDPMPPCPIFIIASLYLHALARQVPVVSILFYCFSTVCEYLVLIQINHLKTIKFNWSGLLFSRSFPLSPLKSRGLVAALNPLGPRGWWLGPQVRWASPQGRWAGRSSCHHGLFLARLTLRLPECYAGPRHWTSTFFLPSPSPHQTPGQTFLISRSTFIQQSCSLCWYTKPMATCECTDIIKKRKIASLAFHIMRRFVPYPATIDCSS